MTRLAVETGAIKLGQGFPDGGEPPALLDAAAAALHAGHKQYAPLPGGPRPREAIPDPQRRHYGIELDPDTQVQVTFGATEAIAAALLALVEPGDEVAMLDPSYDSYGAIVALAGGTAVPIPLAPPDWRITSVEQIGPRTRVLLLHTPPHPPRPLPRPRARRARARPAGRGMPRARRHARHRRGLRAPDLRRRAHPAA